MPRLGRHPHAPVLDALRRFGLALPGAHTQAPWPGHLDLAVRDKTFAYLSLEHEPLRVGVKLPLSGALALTMPNVEPSPYGPGKRGWVTARFADSERPPLRVLEAWGEQRVRLPAPKTLVQRLDAVGPGEARDVAPRRRGACG